MIEPVYDKGGIKVLLGNSLDVLAEMEDASVHAVVTDPPYGLSNTTPTVKPLDLMRWLVRLVTPPGGVVLDPHGGSGTTAEAALLEGFDCVVIEQEPTYAPLIIQRLDRRRDPATAVRRAAKPDDDGSLFDLLDPA